MNEAALDSSSGTQQTALAEPHEPLLVLKHARESAGLHIAALAAALKVPVRKLEALEAGRYEELPDLTFARALASSACRHLKVDPKPILDQIPMGRQPVLGGTGQAINAPFKATVPGASGGMPAWLLRPSVLIAALLTAAALVLLLLPDWIRLPAWIDSAETAPGVSQQRVEAVQLETPFPASAAEADGAVAVGSGQPAPVETVGVSEQTPAEGATVASTGQTATPVTGAAAAVAGGVPAASTAESSSGAGAVLSIAATGESWVEVTNATGAVVAQRMLKAGDVLEFASAPPYKVILGRAEAAKVTVRGKPFDVLPYARNSVARFEAR
jgi:cytoskeleton protein RodZ